ncbi:MAG: polyribonucleotide nucleotidyltransferase [Puniceicoccales bacterium]|jgi:polyribonucleotide nucleotidyltransferase|nr:polyribonucleotide nucleotidyltransferase [Puniceicoccales bacterium]
MKQLFNVEAGGIHFSTGSLAKQANGTAVVTLGETSVFVSAVAAKKCLPEQNYFPLMVDYRERFTAAGKFPGGYAKREGKPSEKEVLTSRLCDRPLRPLFPKGFMNEVQVIGILLAADGKNEPDTLMVNGASAALACSDIPWAGPVGCIRLGDIDGEFIVNPTNEQMQCSRLDLLYVGNERDMMMIEGNADQLSEERFVEALAFAQQRIQPLIEAQKELVRQCGKPKKTFTLHTVPENIMAICEKSRERLAEAVFQAEKAKRENDVESIEAEAKADALAAIGENVYEEASVHMAFEELQEELYRKNILEYGRRVDGRAIDEIRPLHCETNILPRVHGTALFQRGETQAFVSLTLGSSRDVQELDAITGGIKTKTFLLHYNFPPFCVGETGKTIGAGRREIGHGALAERSLSPVIPAESVFPYSIRIVSDILESNGSSSMASVCGGCLALMDAGVPILAPVSGISTGLVAEFDGEGNLKKHVVLTDIIGDEDHFGDMDFKICGTAKGITGFQLDLKIRGLPLAVAEEAIYRNKEARARILEAMLAVQPGVNETLKPSAPGFKEVYIDPDKIGALIGPGGKNIKRLTESTGSQIDIDEDNSGRVMIFSPNQESLDRVLVEINAMNAEIEVGKTYKGMVKSIKEFGAFVECLPGKEGLVHVSELAEFRVDNVEDICKLNGEIIVKCVGVDEKGRVRLSRRAVLCEAKGEAYVSSKPVSDRKRFQSGNNNYSPRRRA